MVDQESTTQHIGSTQQALMEALPGKATYLLPPPPVSVAEAKAAVSPCHGFRWGFRARSQLDALTGLERPRKGKGEPEHRKHGISRLSLDYSHSQPSSLSNQRCHLQGNMKTTYILIAAAARCVGSGVRVGNGQQRLRCDIRLTCHAPSRGRTSWLILVDSDEFMFGTSPHESVR